MRSLLHHVLKRVIALLVTLFIITALVYATVMLTPAETRATLYMPKNTSPRMTEEAYQELLERMIERYHLNDPFPVQYYYWVTNLLQGIWGYSPTLQQDVFQAIIQRAPATAELTIFSILAYIPLGLISGVISGSQKNKAADHGFRSLAYVATSLPPFILAMLLLASVYVDLHWFAPERTSMSISFIVTSDEFRTYTGLLTIDGLLNGRPDITLDALRHLVMPVFTLGIYHWATLGRITRAMMIEELQKDYVVTARSLGLPEHRITWRHTLRNAIAPAFSSIALSAAALLTGVYVVETIFNFRGISHIAVNSMAFVPDAPAAMGFTIYSVIVILLLMIVMDLIQYFLDPRLRAED